jgi:UDP-N-acetylmuramoyl-L-alanyl-D-glutamate--2,6-diaminopimelate ligase
MLLREFLGLQEVEESGGEPEREITGLSYDSRQVRKGDVFFAVPGGKVDGHDFIGRAIERDAAAVVVERKVELDRGTSWVQVRDVRRSMGLWSARFFGHPSREMTVIGVTGTNGKTTVTYLVESVLAAAGLEPGVIGTVNYRYGGRELPSHHTTPESLDLHALLAEMKRASIRAVAMEVSSHALVQERVRGIDFDLALFTNLSRDHLDYHRDMDDYFAAKSRLFIDYLQNSAKAKRAAVIHADDRWGAELLKKVNKLGFETWSYGREGDWHVRPLDVQSDVRGLRGRIQAKGETLDFCSPLIGAANLENILGAVAAGFALGLPALAIRRGIEGLKSVPGRLEKVENHLGISVLVDYAHTPNALERVLLALRGLLSDSESRVPRPGSRVGALRLETRDPGPETRNPRPKTRDPRLICVFGCGGDRDSGKRPLMGEIAARLSDLVFLTSDNPRTEDPAAIIKDIEAGVQKTGLKKLLTRKRRDADGASETRDSERGYYVDPDRRAAIEMALREAGAGDVVLIAGKGHEDYQILGTTKIHFDDREVAREKIALIGNS